MNQSNYTLLLCLACPISYALVFMSAFVLARRGLPERVGPYQLASDKRRSKRSKPERPVGVIEIE